MDEYLGRGEYKTAFDVTGIWAQREGAWAENCLGSLYLTGLGIERDLSKAFYLFYRAAKHGNSAAWYSMGVLFEVVETNSLRTQPYRTSVISGRRS